MAPYQHLFVDFFYLYIALFIAYLITKIVGIRLGSPDTNSLFSREMFLRAQLGSFPLFLGLGTFADGMDGHGMAFIPATFLLLFGVFFTFTFFKRQMLIAKDDQAGLKRSLWLFPLYGLTGLFLLPFVFGWWVLIVFAWLSPDKDEAAAERMAEESRYKQDMPRRLW
jgi:Na+/proline symporter